jgi:quercetin dioxygenase-like cupin family protein
MPLNISPVPRPDWTPLPQNGCVNVEGEVLLIQDNLTIAMLRFGHGGTIPKSQAGYPTDVICLEGGGFTSVSGEEGELSPGFQVRWPANEPHQLWTEDESMVALMIEHYTPSG